jgi:hypothetical protein
MRWTSQSNARDVARGGVDDDATYQQVREGRYMNRKRMVWHCGRIVSWHGHSALTVLALAIPLEMTRLKPQ